MASKKKQSVFSCQSCGYQTPKWMGRCPECGQWHTLVEERLAKRGGGAARGRAAAVPVAIDAISDIAEDRRSTAIGELDRVLGGGLVPGSVVLIGGDPGIGKSTLMLQTLFGLARQELKVLYVSGEESIHQIRMRSRRLEAVSPHLFVVAEVDLDGILRLLSREKPDVLVVDSIQTVYSQDLTSAPGSISQVRESTMRLMLAAKSSGTPIFLVGHVTKGGAIAGPRLLEHMVDTVLYFEGDRNHVFRILRAVKNRFGSTNEIGVFEMKDRGLAEVVNPSAIFLAERPPHAPGSVVTACMEGTRPIMVELQALAASTGLGTARRTILGLDSHRVALLVAVMEKRLGMHLMGHDIFMNVAGGVRVEEPAADLGIVAAVASSFLNRPLAQGVTVVGEVGLAGEVRAVSHLDTRVREMKKMGFSRCIVPANSVKRTAPAAGIELLGAGSVEDAVEMLFEVQSGMSAP